MSKSHLPLLFFQKISIASKLPIKLGHFSVVTKNIIIKKKLFKKPIKTFTFI
jgi:hypothetical protein